MTDPSRLVVTCSLLSCGLAFAASPPPSKPALPADHARGMAASRLPSVGPARRDAVNAVHNAVNAALRPSRAMVPPVSCALT